MLILYEVQALIAVERKFLVGTDKRHTACHGMSNDDMVEWVVVVWAWAQIKESTHHVQIYGQNVYLILLQYVTNQSVSRWPAFAVEILVALFNDDFAHTLHADTE